MERPIKIGEFEVPIWWDCVWRRVPCGANTCRCCGRVNAHRKKHIERGEDPDSMDAVMEDMKECFSDVRIMIARDAERRGIDLSKPSETSDDDDFDPMQVPRAQRALAWLRRLSALGEGEADGGFWRATEAAADLFWYSNTVVVKTARDIDNLHALARGDESAHVDFIYTRYILHSVYPILENALIILERSVLPHRAAFAELRADLLRMSDEWNLSQTLFPLLSNSRE